MANNKKETLDEINRLTTEKIDPIKEKVDQCYSKERFQDFQEDVKKIVIDILGHDDGKEKLKPFIKSVASNEYDDKAWKTKQFWIPTVLSAIGVIVALLIAYYK